MKKIIYIYVCVLFFNNLIGQQSPSTLMTVGNAKVSVEEFRYIYEKNNGKTADYSEKSLTEYTDLYAKFKLKVEKAKQLKMDTIESLKEELQGYRKQLSSGFLVDKGVTEFILKEAYDRVNHDIQFSHIFLSASDATPKSTQKELIKKLEDIKSKIAKGMKFEDAAAIYSEDKMSSANSGKMGYFSAMLPDGFYELENALYQTPVGSISGVVQSKIGLHLLKVTDKRPARGKVEVAHILFGLESKNDANMVYEQLKSGVDFAELAKTHSIDKSSILNEGRLPVFGINTYESNFEDAAFGLKNVGDITNPVSTNAGWHIIKLIKKEPKDSYEMFVKRMKPQILKDQRFNLARLKFIQDIKNTAGMKVFEDKIAQFTAELKDDFYTYRWNYGNNAQDNEIVCSIGGSTKYSLKDFGDFCKKNVKIRLKYDNSKPIVETVNELFDEFTNEKALEFEEKNLPIKYPEFASIMREYEEGILLFEVTKDHVWDKANTDSIGIQKYFEKNISKYSWPESANVIKYKINTPDPKLAKEIYQFAKKNGRDKTIKKYAKLAGVLHSESTVCEKDNAQCFIGLWQAKSITSMSNQENVYTFEQILNIIPTKKKAFSEARGYVVSDYQDYLEKTWVEDLKKDFKVEINKEVFNSLIKK